jgi:hypothetical protein
MLVTTFMLYSVMSLTATAPQEVDNLFSKVDHVFQQKEPAWKIERVYPTSTSDPVTHGVVYRSKMGQAAIDVSVWRREQDARDVFSGLVIAFDNTAGNQKLKRSLPNVGDENYMWTNPRNTAWPTIKFRKGRILVTVFAPNVTIAKRFADHVLKQIEDR